MFSYLIVQIILYFKHTHTNIITPFCFSLSIYHETLPKTFHMVTLHITGWIRFLNMTSGMWIYWLCWRSLRSPPYINIVLTVYLLVWPCVSYLIKSSKRGEKKIATTKKKKHDLHVWKFSKKTHVFRTEHIPEHQGMIYYSESVHSKPVKENRTWGKIQKKPEASFEDPSL